MLGRIVGKATTLSFSFELGDEADVKKFEYVKVPHRVYEWVLCQVLEIEKNQERSLAKCNVLGYVDKGKVKQVRIPFDIGSEVFLADDEFITEVIQLDTENGAYVGKLDGKQIPVNLDLSKLLTKHIAILAKSGAGKSYALGVLIEEILERKVPVLIIDPHGEYGSLGKKSEDDDERLARHGIKPKSYEVREYGTHEQPELIPLRLPNNLTQQELIHLIPGKLNNTQLGILYSALNGMEEVNFETVLLGLEQEESNAKWSVINLIEHIRGLGIFSNAPVAYNELVKSGVASVINMRGIAPDIQQVIVYKLAKDLFELRKMNKVPPFFLVIEEAHNYCPERSFGETTSSKILRTIASEGRKFGLGLAVVSQRPARVDKSVLSQCTTQMILKVTNPNDLRAVGNSVEGLTAESEAEIQNLSIGTALVTGVVDMPLFVNIRPRKTAHGGHAVDILDQPESFEEQTSSFQDQELLPIIKPKTTPQDLKLMAEGDAEVRTILIPSYLFSCKEKDNAYKLLVDMTNGEVVVDVEEGTTSKLPTLRKLSPVQMKILMAANSLKEFDKEEIIQKIKTTVEIDDDLKDLLEHEYLSHNTENDSYSITNNYILSKLSKHAVYTPVEYEQVRFDIQRDAKMNLDKVKEQLSRFTKVLDQQECQLVRYELE
ncbi:ATP-binding protein [Candidatus Woesearchaeota archaeon]|nr:ATP-binding protein [Candidatus Woesearchaeota archaeon]